MGIQAIIDSIITPHGNWQGLTPGWVTTIWLTHILVRHNHRMDYVQEGGSQALADAATFDRTERHAARLPAGVSSRGNRINDFHLGKQMGAGYDLLARP